MHYKTPLKLKEGDIIDVIAPSFTAPRELESLYNKISELLNSIGLIARIPKDLIQTDKDLFCANSLEYRKNHFINSILNSESKAIWALRGGYGAAQIIPYLEQITPPDNAKFVIGFSDITALHLFLMKKWHWQCLHAAVLNQVVTNPNLLAPIKSILFGEGEVNYTRLKLINNVIPKNNLIEGEIVGGNCSIIQTSIGTSWQIDTRNKILFIEDVGERGYKIHRMLTHFMQARVLNSVKAIICGLFNDGAEKDGNDYCMAALKNVANSLNIPVLYYPFIGHDANHNYPLPLGALAKLEFSKEISLVISSS